MKTKSSEIGIMPFFRHYGFVFVDRLQETERFVKATAHELGHGVYGLEHPFVRHEGLDAFETENLMSWHPTATKLCKYQWDLIHNPVCWLDGSCGTGETEAMMAKINTLAVLRIIQKIRYSYTFNKPLKVTVTDITTGYNDDVVVIGFLDKKFEPELGPKYKDYFTNSNCRVTSLKGSIIDETLSLKRDIDWDYASWNNGLIFETQQGKKFRLIFNYLPNPPDDKFYEWFKAYLFSTGDDRWKSDFKDILGDNNIERMKYKLVTIPFDIYKELDYNEAELFLDTLISRNYNGDWLEGGVIFEQGKYGSYLCMVTKYLLNKYFDKSFESCSDFDDKYKSLDDIVGYQRKIDDAIEYVIENFLGKPYSWGDLDCSGLVGRYLRKLNDIKPYNKRLSFNTDYYAYDYSQEDKYLIYLSGSADTTFRDIRRGDVFLWSRKPGDGHMGIVLDYDKENDIVKILEAISRGAINDSFSFEKAKAHNELTEMQKDHNYYKNSVRISYYKRQSGTLGQHPGWIGYYRPIIKSKSKQKN